MAQNRIFNFQSATPEEKAQALLEELRDPQCDEAYAADLVNNGARLDRRNASGHTPLLAALQWGRQRALRGILARDPSRLQDTDAFGNTALFALLVVPAQVVLAFLLALWVNRPEPAWRWLRGVFFVPTIVSMPVLAVLWTLLYQPAHGAERGLVNAALGVLGVAPRAWLHDPTWALPALAVMSAEIFPLAVLKFVPLKERLTLPLV